MSWGLEVSIIALLLPPPPPPQWQLWIAMAMPSSSSSPPDVPLAGQDIVSWKGRLNDLAIVIRGVYEDYLGHTHPSILGLGRAPRHRAYRFGGRKRERDCARVDLLLAEGLSILYIGSATRSPTEEGRHRQVEVGLGPRGLRRAAPRPRFPTSR